MKNKDSDYFRRSIVWNKTKDAEFPFEVYINQRRVTIRLNDFPVETLYTLLIDNKPVSDFDDWPENWRRP
ncbi:hypothetical protein QUF72_06810 [Desulfobacterales bacterium HSG2]|nr:hypothetical protein [Desulfobacterales bacterium HSG2]